MRTYTRFNNAQALGLGLLIYFAGNLDAITKIDLYPYGEPQGDERLQVGDDISSSEIQLVVPISFYERLHTSLYVSKYAYSYLLLLLFFFHIGFVSRTRSLADIFTDLPLDINI